MSHPRKRKSRENDEKEGKTREVKIRLDEEEKQQLEEQEEKVEFKPSLAPMHQQMMDVILGPYLEDDALDELKPQEKARLLYLMLYPDDVKGSDVLFFKSHQLLDNIIFIHKIFLHEHPQNRVSGDPGAFSKGYLKGRDTISFDEEEASHRDSRTGMFAGTGVFEDTVYYFTDEGFSGPVLTEPQGLLGLTTRVTDPLVTKAAVIEYLNHTISDKLSSLPEPIPAEFKDPRYTESMSEAFDYLLANGQLTLDYIDKRGVNVVLQDVQTYLKFPKVRKLIDQDIIQILDEEAMLILEKALRTEEKSVKYFLRNGTDLYTENEIIEWGNKNLVSIARLYHQPNVRKMIKFQIANGLEFDPIEMLEDPEIQVIRIANSFVKPVIFKLIESKYLSFHDFYDNFKLYDQILGNETVRDFLTKGIFSHDILQAFLKNNLGIVAFCQITSENPNLKSLLESNDISAIDLSMFIKKKGLEETLKAAELFVQCYATFKFSFLTFADIAKMTPPVRNTIRSTMQLLKEHKLDDFADFLIMQRQLTLPHIIQHGPEVILRVVEIANRPQNNEIIIQGGFLVPRIIEDTIADIARERQRLAQSAQDIKNPPEAKRKPS